MIHQPPIRSRAVEEGNVQIPLWTVAAILLVLYACQFSGLGALGLTGPDEPRYAAIAQAMVTTHDWVTPTLWGTPWFEKPVLYYWAAGIAMRIFGTGEFAARLPSALAALLAVVAMGWTALRCYGVGAACTVVLMLPASVAMIGFSRAASPDMLFAGLLTAALAAACEILQTNRPSAAIRIAFGAFAGAAVLAKGPAAIILSGGALLLWALVARQWQTPLRFLHPLVISAFALVALPWYILCALRNPQFLRVFIWQHNFQRYLTPVFEHRQPFWFFAPILLVGSLPWLPLVIYGCADIARHRPLATLRSSPSLFISCWMLFTLLFFSASQSKLPGYVLPAIPPAVLLLSRALTKRMERKSTGIRVTLAIGGLLFPVLLGIVHAKFHPVFFPLAEAASDPNRGILLALIVAVIGCALVVTAAFRGRMVAAVGITACTAAILILVANATILPGLDASLSARPGVAFAMRGHSLTAGDVAVLRLPRAYGYQLNYYLGMDLPEFVPGDAHSLLFVGKEELPLLKQFPATRNLSETHYFPVTPDGKIILIVLK